MSTNEGDMANDERGGSVASGVRGVAGVGKYHVGFCKPW